MNPKQKFVAIHDDITRSLVDLLDVLEDIDLNDPSNDENEWSISDGNGGRIELAYVSNGGELTITKGALKLSVNVSDIKGQK